MTTAHSSTAPPPSRVQAHVAPEDPHRRGSGLSHRQHPRLPRNGATRPVPQALSRLLSPPGHQLPAKGTGLSPVTLLGAPGADRDEKLLSQPLHGWL